MSILTCLAIATITAVCQLAPAPSAATCHTKYYPEPIRYCYAPQPEAFPLYMSVYDPALCDEYPINCYGDPKTTANGHKWQYGDNTAACPIEWINKQIEVAGRLLICQDTGGAIHPTYRNYWDWIDGRFSSGWVIMIDVLEDTGGDVSGTVRRSGWLMLPHWEWEFSE